jgi:hypothetical protein
MAICLPVCRWRRKATIAARVADGVWFGNEWGFDEAIAQALNALRPEARRPLGDGFRPRPKVACCRRQVQARFDNCRHQGLSIFTSEKRILMVVHSVPESLKLRRPQPSG